MKKTLLKSILVGSAMIFAAMPIFSQEVKEEKKGYEFTTVKEVKITPTKNQFKSGTCWSFSSHGFLESEMIRMGKPEMDLSEMFVVWHCYSDKAEKYVRYHGSLNFGGGGSNMDVLNCIKKHGIVPEEVYKGLNYGTDKHVHAEMDAVLKAYLVALIENKTLTTAWHNGFNGILNAYLGEIPKEFDYKGKKYTPISFAKETGINPDDYITLTSYTHHPFYGKFILEVPDNWAFDNAYNVTIDDMTKIMDNAINNGYTIAWASDVSEKGVSFKNGVAVVPEADLASMKGSERERWEKLSDKEKEAELYKFDKPCKEKVITQEIRQQGFDNYETGDDHGMQIFGIAKDQNGTKYYMIKNSWGTDYNSYQGIAYISETYMKYKTMSFMIHKDALPKDLKEKLGIK
ncbi:MAG: C1 family peptidase [Bacteroidota bacterium]